MALAGSDPRLAFAASDEADIRPIVAKTYSGLPWWILIGGMILAAVLLFSVLEARRRAATAPATRPRVADMNALPADVAPLYIPPAPMPPPVLLLPTPAPPLPPLRPAPVKAAPVLPPVLYTPPYPVAPPLPLPPPSGASPTIAPGLVYDASSLGTASNDGAAAAAVGDAAAPVAAIGARASVIQHLPTLVPQGTLIPAVLETALDSTRPGPARAIVARNVRGFDGVRVLIPRGSRLIGDYRADLEAGQNRAQIIWVRLIRPDGVSIALGSPAGDDLGRVGVRGKVDGHFLARLGSALLQTSLYVGGNLASQLGNSAVIVAAPGTVQTLASPIAGSGPIKPTLRVKQGAAITVFVARDLDFTAVEAGK